MKDYLYENKLINSYIVEILCINFFDSKKPINYNYNIVRKKDDFLQIIKGFF